MSAPSDGKQGRKRKVFCSEEERIARRRASKRLSDFKYRKQRQDNIDQLQKQVENLFTDNTRLRNTNNELISQLESVLLENRLMRDQQRLSTVSQGSSDYDTPDNTAPKTLVAHVPGPRQREHCDINSLVENPDQAGSGAEKEMKLENVSDVSNIMAENNVTLHQPALPSSAEGINNVGYFQQRNVVQLPTISVAIGENGPCYSVQDKQPLLLHLAFPQAVVVTGFTQNLAAPNSSTDNNCHA